MLKLVIYATIIISALYNISLHAQTSEQATEKSSNSAKVHNPIVKPYTAQYSILHKSKPIGTATRKLTYLEDGAIQYTYKSNIEWLIFSDIREESSLIKLTNNKVTPFHYIYKREGTGRDKAYEWTYNIANNTASDIKKGKELTIDFPVNLQDKLSYHLQHRVNMITNPEQKTFVYPVISTSGKIKNYVYQYDGEEDLILPYGLIKTVRLKREVIEKKRVTYAWFAPELNYLLVKLYQVKAGNSQMEAQLTAISLEE